MTKIDKEMESLIELNRAQSKAFSFSLILNIALILALIF